MPCPGTGCDTAAGSFGKISDQRVLVKLRWQGAEAGTHQSVQGFRRQPAAAPASLSGFRLEAPSSRQAPAQRPQHPESVHRLPERQIGLEFPVPVGQPQPFRRIQPGPARHHPTVLAGIRDVPRLRLCPRPGRRDQSVEAGVIEGPAADQPSLQHQGVAGLLTPAAAITFPAGQRLVEAGQTQRPARSPIPQRPEQQRQIVAAGRHPVDAERVARQAHPTLGPAEIEVIDGGHRQLQTEVRCHGFQLSAEGALAGPHRPVQSDHGKPAQPLTGLLPPIAQRLQQREGESPAQLRIERRGP
jgi:hypothetical protein